jgi:general secretion pathway protein D
MRINSYKQLFGGLVVFLLSAAVELHAQQRTGGGGGGGGGFGGFGGFGGGGFGGGNRNGSSSSSSQYNNNGTVGNAVISVDPVTHNVVVIADKQTSEQIRKVIESLDVPEPQVLIKVVFLEVQRNDSSEIGVQGSYTGNPFGTSIASIAGYVTNYAVSSIGSNAVPTIVPTSITPTYQSMNLANNMGLPAALSSVSGSGGMYQVLGSDFTATIQAIAAAGKSQVLSRPSILARDGQLAKIVVGQDIYLPSGVSYNTVGVTTTPIINGTYTEVGIILDVTPFIGANGLVEMIVQPQTSAVDSSSPGQVIATGGILGSPVYAPNLNIRSADTVVVTPSGQTVVIGGLITSSKSSADTKVPFLGDIPLLGQLFRASNKAQSRTELLMFLTPHIVEAPAQLVALTNPEMHQAPLITNSITEQELDRFLERVPAKKDEPVKRKKLN